MRDASPRNPNTPEPAFEPVTTRRPVGGTRRCPHCGPVTAVPFPADGDPAAPGDRCPFCGFDFPPEAHR
jgi:hypothetical protein